MRNMTITLSEDAAEWARIEAARRDTSVSKMVGGMIEQKMRKDDEYERARRAYFSVQPRVMSARGDRYPTREETYVRGYTDIHDHGPPARKKGGTRK